MFSLAKKLITQIMVRGFYFSIPGCISVYADVMGMSYVKYSIIDAGMSVWLSSICNHVVARHSPDT